MITLLALTSAAHAFCGTYVGPLGSTVTNKSSQVIVAHNDGETVLTLAPDFSGNTTTFAMVIPVPEVLDEDDVSLQDWELFEAMDGFSAPRLVEYTCDTAKDCWATQPDCDNPPGGTCVCNGTSCSGTLPVCGGNGYCECDTGSCTEAAYPVCSASGGCECDATSCSNLSTFVHRNTVMVCSDRD